SARSPEDSSAELAGFPQGLAEVGYVEGENLAIEYRWARSNYERLPARRGLSRHRCASSRPSAVNPRLWWQRRQPGQSRSSLPCAILYRPALSTVTPGRGETSQASISCRPISKPSGSACCMI